MGFNTSSVCFQHTRFRCASSIWNRLLDAISHWIPGCYPQGRSTLSLIISQQSPKMTLLENINLGKKNGKTPWTSARNWKTARQDIATEDWELPCTVSISICHISSRTKAKDVKVCPTQTISWRVRSRIWKRTWIITVVCRRRIASDSYVVFSWHGDNS